LGKTKPIVANRKHGTFVGEPLPAQRWYTEIDAYRGVHQHIPIELPDNSSNSIAVRRNLVARIIVSEEIMRL